MKRGGGESQLLFVQKGGGGHNKFHPVLKERWGSF